MAYVYVNGVGDADQETDDCTASRYERERCGGW